MSQGRQAAHRQMDARAVRAARAAAWAAEAAMAAAPACADKAST
jgi:hypothetical protein